MSTKNKAMLVGRALAFSALMLFIEFNTLSYKYNWVTSLAMVSGVIIVNYVCSTEKILGKDVYFDGIYKISFLKHFGMRVLQIAAFLVLFNAYSISKDLLQEWVISVAACAVMCGVETWFICMARKKMANE
jgi:hypothetical protein